MNGSDAFKKAQENMSGLRLSGPRQTTYEQLISMAKGLGMTFTQMDDYLGLKDGSYAEWVKSAPREAPPKPVI